MIYFSSLSEPPLAPENIYVKFSNFSELSFMWIPLNMSCPALNYSITTNNCGTCATDYGSAVTTCTNYPKRDRVNECRFTVQSIICGNVTAPSSISNKIVNLQGNLKYLS